MVAHFFITGGTGLVGLNMIPRLLLKFPDSIIALLVRGSNDAEVLKRVDHIRTQVSMECRIPDVKERIEGIRGDVNLERCGMTSSQLMHVVNRTTHIIHGAATIRFDHPIEEARTINCGGTRRMLSIAQMCIERGNLERFVYIGSSSVSGQRAGNIYEHELETGQRFFNTYEQS